MKFEIDSTLLEILGAILPDNIRLPHSKIIAQTLYEKTLQKFMACTEIERRGITRSDPEFMALLRDTIIKGCGFKSELEAFGKEIEIPEIPRIERGNELVWYHKADPQEPITEELPEVVKRLDFLRKIISQKIEEYYPDDYAKSFSDSKLYIIDLSTANVEFIEQLENADPESVRRIGLPLMTRTILNHVAEKNHLKAEQLNEMYETILDAAWNEANVGHARTLQNDP